MTGSGTQTDPYVIESYTDFCSMTTSQSNYYKLGIDIDFSEIDRQAGDSAISILCSELDGDGHTISNFFKRESSSSSINSFFVTTQTRELIIKNTIFKGIYLVCGNTCFIKASCSVVYKNCKIGVKIIDTYTNSSYPFFGNGGGNLNDCEILMEGTTNYTKALTATNGSVNGCLVKLNMIYHNSSVTSNLTILGKTASCTGVVGKINCLDESGARYAFTSGESNTCYYALEMNVATTITAGSFSGVNFYDKDLMENVADKMPVNDHLYALTTEQCKSVEYLQSIGFPCISGDLI